VLRHVLVPGGGLAVEELSGQTPPVLAIHGISSQRRLWDWLKAAAPELTLLAPDLRGRGDSVAVEGPSSMARHAEDMVAVLDAFGVDEAHVCGMSMGGFVAVTLAVAHPERVKSLILVDGGFPMARPSGLTREMLPGIFQDRLGRLEQTWPSLDAYLAYFTSQTAPLLDPKDPVLRQYLAHDLVDGRVRLSGKALLEDADDVFFGESPWTEIKVPTRLLCAEWSIGPDTPPAYPPDAVAEFKTTTTTRIRTDHAGTIMTAAGGEATAALIREALAG
jgi:pimeloyl-ACP methyl ester carboxylesterase